MIIEGSVAVVTGAGSGIGRALAVALAAAGADVAAGDLDGAAAQRTAEMIRAEGGSAIGLESDAAVEDGIAELLAAGRTEFGPVGIFVANAGIVGAPGLGDEADWDRVLAVNLRAHIRAARAVLPQWIERGQGHFVSVASAAGLLTQLGAAGYAVSKHAAVGFAEWLAISHGDDGIGVTCVCPMGVETPLLRDLAGADDARARLAGASVVGAGSVLDPAIVAELTVAAIRDGGFLVLPHPEVATMLANKTADRDRWIAGMTQYSRTLA